MAQIRLTSLEGRVIYTGRQALVAGTTLLPYLLKQVSQQGVYSHIIILEV
jgi:hypothetical protein